MLPENNYRKFLLSELVDSKEGNDLFNTLLDSFSSINDDVEFFLKNNAVQSVKLRTSSTYLILSPSKLDLLGYFTLATKMLSIKKKILSNTKIKIFQRFGYYDEESDSYKIPAILIAQFSRNFHPQSESISGTDLMQITLKQVDHILSLSSGKTVFLECERIKALTDFYEQNEFLFLDNVIMSKDNKELLQLYQLL